jgi:hypothetical protein
MSDCSREFIARDKAENFTRNDGLWTKRTSGRWREESVGREVQEVKFQLKFRGGGIFKGASAESAALSNNICTEDSLELDIILKLYTVVYFPESFLDDPTEDGLSFLRVERINTISPSASDELRLLRLHFSNIQLKNNT